MSTTRSSITRLLRAAVSHRNATTNTLLRPHHNLRRHQHFFTPISPLSLIRSHPFNHRISNHHYFSTFTFQRVKPRPTKSLFRRVVVKLMYGVILQICITGAYTLMLGKFLRESQEILDSEKGTKFKGSLTNLVREGHSVVIDGFIKPVKREDVDWGFVYCYSLTEVVSEPDLIVAAMERNSYIIAEKQNVAAEEEEEEKLNVPGEEREVLVNWCRTPSGEISKDVADPTKSKSRHKGLVLEGRVNQSAAYSLAAKLRIVKLLKDALKDFKGLSDALREGHSVVVERSVKPTKHGNKEEDKWDKSVAVKVWDSECHISAEVLVKHDEKYMPHDVVSAAALE